MWKYNRTREYIAVVTRRSNSERWIFLSVSDGRKLWKPVASLSKMHARNDKQLENPRGRRSAGFNR
jgi:hypothetical protein